MLKKPLYIGFCQAKNKVLKEDNNKQIIKKLILLITLRAFIN